MKTISVGELRQNPTEMLNEVGKGETYYVTRHSQPVACVVPPIAGLAITPPKKQGAASTCELSHVELPAHTSFDAFLDEVKGEW